MLLGGENVSVWAFVLHMSVPVCVSVHLWVSQLVFLKSDPSVLGSQKVSIPRPLTLPTRPGEAATSPESHGLHSFF